MNEKYWALKKQSELNKLQNRTKQFLEDMDSIINDFSEHGDVKQLGSKLKKQIKQFQQDLDN